MGGLDAGFRSRGEELFQPSVPERANHFSTVARNDTGDCRWPDLPAPPQSQAPARHLPPSPRLHESSPIPPPETNQKCLIPTPCARGVPSTSRNSVETSPVTPGFRKRRFERSPLERRRMGRAKPQSSFQRSGNDNHLPAAKLIAGPEIRGHNDDEELRNSRHSQHRPGGSVGAGARGHRLPQSLAFGPGSPRPPCPSMPSPICSRRRLSVERPATGPTGRKATTGSLACGSARRRSAAVLWTPGYWGWWVALPILWHEGYWGPHVGFYGGINYGFGYGGVGFWGGRWEGDHFAYNTYAVMNVGIRGGIHSTLRRQYTTIVNSVNVHNHVSFNGGNGGIQAHASAQEQQWSHENHVAPTGEQMSHVRNAHADHSNFAAANGGHPVNAAFSRPGSNEEAVRSIGAPAARDGFGHANEVNTRQGNQQARTGSTAESIPAR